MKRKGGHRTSSRSTKTSTSDADGLIELIFYLAWLLMEISLFFRYLIVGGVVTFLILIILPNPALLAPVLSFLVQSVSVITLAVWGGASAYGPYLDSIDFYT